MTVFVGIMGWLFGPALALGIVLSLLGAPEVAITAGVYVGFGVSFILGIAYAIARLRGG